MIKSIGAICTATERGVDVSIIVSRDNNSMMLRWASSAFFTELLNAAVKIYRFEDGLLYSKSVLVDGQLILVGTIKLDMRSLWLNFEMTLVIDDDCFGNDLATVQADCIALSVLLNANEWAKHSLLHQVTERLFYFFRTLL